MRNTNVMKLRKALAVVLTFALLFSAIPFNSIVRAATTEIAHLTFSSVDDAQKADISGGAGLTLVGGKEFIDTDGQTKVTGIDALYLSKRANDWDGTDFFYSKNQGWWFGKRYIYNNCKGIR
ncbi:MAG TPA: hypothetical protein VHP38_04845 [Ruminiclostridium sp.]|nr:hypothetical protein [Ruminiclostridium sp.]